MNDPRQPPTAPRLPATCHFTIAGIRVFAQIDQGEPIWFSFRGAPRESWFYELGPDSRLFPIFRHLLHDHLRKQAGVEGGEARGC